MKIHVHTPSFFPTLVGMTYATHVHALLLHELGADVTVVAPQTSAIEPLPESVPYKTRRFAVSGNGLPLSPLRGDVPGILSFTRDERPDIVIAEGWFTVGAVLLPKMQAFARHVVLSSHGSADLALERVGPSQVARSLAYRWEEATRSRHTMRRLSAALVLSTYEDRLRFSDIQRFRAVGTPMYVCPNVSTYTHSDGHPLRAHRVDVIHIGEMKPHKNPKQAVRTIAELKPHAHLTLIFPQRTDYLTEVLGLAERLGVRDRVHQVVGRSRSQLEPVIACADILLITSQSKDVQPIVAVDALAKGVPFVSTDVGCMREFSGGLVAAPEGLSTAIERITSNAEEYRGFSRDACIYRDRALTPDIARRALATMLDDLSH